MIIYICDRCKQHILDNYIFHIVFSGNNKVDVCRECGGQFKEWLFGSVKPNEPPKENDAE